MAYKIKILQQAEKDLHEIVTYIKNELYSPAAAERTFEIIASAIERAAEAPHMYPMHYPVRPLKHDYRKIPVNGYLVFYWVEEAEKAIVVARVIHGKRNYLRPDSGTSCLNEPPMKWRLK